MNEPVPPAQARKQLSRILVSGGDVEFTAHALEELSRDNMTTEDAVRVLRTGRIYEPAERRGDEWRYRVHAPDACCVITFDDEPDVLVITGWRKNR